MSRQLKFLALACLCSLIASNVHARIPEILPMSESFWVWDLSVMPPDFRRPSFTLRASRTLSDEKDRVHVWVEDKLGRDEPGAEVVQSLLRLLAADTPEGSLDPGAGVIELERRYFGAQPTPPSGDRDFHVLITRLHNFENDQGQTFGFDGFFNVFDQLPEKEAEEYRQRSNGKNIVYVNAHEDFSSPYMRAVVAHELAHLITYGKSERELDGWMSEMLGEGAMQMTGFYTDVRHVQKYRANTQWPLAVAMPVEARSNPLLRSLEYGLFPHLAEITADTGFRISYGGVSMLAEFLLRRHGPALFGKLASAPGASAFAQLEAVYGLSWNSIFAEYVQWLFEQESSPWAFESRFPGEPVAVREMLPVLRLATTGVLYLSNATASDSERLKIVSVPKGCTSSRNVLRTRMLSRTDRDAPRNGAAGQKTATALWVESTPPCSTPVGESAFETDAFVIETAN